MDEQQDSADECRGFRMGRRTVIGAAAWSVPAISVVTAAPAFAASGPNTLTRTSPATNPGADQLSVSQDFKATLMQNGAPAPGSSVTYTITAATGTDTTWLTFPNGNQTVVVTTDASGVAATTITYGAPKPMSGSTFTVMASLISDPTVQTAWTLAFKSLGDLAVVRVGTGSATLASTGTPVFIDQVTPTQPVSPAFASLPTASAAGQNALTLSGTATSEGALTLSADGRYLALGGYGAAPAAATGGTARVVGLVDSTGSSDTSTALTDAYTANNFRGAVTSNGTNLWTSGTGTPTSSAGVRSTTKGATTSTIVAPTPTNVRCVEIAGGQLFLSTGSGTAGVYAVGSGLPTSGATVATTPAAATPSPYAFAFVSRGAGSSADTLYVADDSTSAGSGGVYKFYLSNGTWQPAGNAKPSIGGTAQTFRGLTATVVGGNVRLIATTATPASANLLVSFLDTSAFADPINVVVESSTAVLATAAANTVYRGVAFRPT